MTTPGLQPPSVSVKRANATTSYATGMCMQFVWKCLDGVHVYGQADANQGWAKAKQRHTDRNPPAGVPVYWGGGKHGHVALSLGGGQVRSTDHTSKGKVGTISIDALTRSWGIPYRGWAADMAGHPIPGVGFNPGNLRLGKASSEARVFNRQVWAYVRRHEADWANANQKAWDAESAGTFGPMSQTAMRKAYASLNRRDPRHWPASETTTPPPAWPGPAFLSEIGCP